VDIKAYWRPKGDTGIGFHYYPNMFHYGKSDLDFWLPELEAMGVSWLVLLSEPNNPIPAFFVKGLIQAGIEPLIRVYTPTVQPLDQKVLRSLLEAYAKLGIHYVHVYNEPNLTEEWDWAEWSKPALVDRFMDALLPCLESMKAVGLFPVFTPLSPGGNYWDTVFLKTALDYIVLKGKQNLFDTMAVAIHNYPGNKPLDWGKGGPARWPDARPYYCPEGSQDHVGFYLFEWYDAIIRARVGRSLPLLCYENGPIVGSYDHTKYPAVDEAAHARVAVEMTRMVMDNVVPDYVFNNAFWLLRNSHGSRFENHAWYRESGHRLPAIQALKAMPKHPRLAQEPATPAPTPGTNGHPLFHYVLCPVWEWGVSEWYWRLLANYVKIFKPVCGFSPDEAALAQYVTVIGRPPGVPSAVEDSLRAKGCRVERIAGADAAETQTILDQMARQRRRFLNFEVAETALVGDAEGDSL
jgi:hypothetical protein